MKKAKAQRRHAKFRAAQRYGFNLTEQIHGEIVALIQAGESNRASLIERQSLRVSQWRIQIGGPDVWLNVIYDKSRKQIATIMP